MVLYSELNDEFWELRKIEVYADGRADFADNKRQSGSTKLGIEPLPSLNEIAADPEFNPSKISAEEFEIMWERALSRKLGLPEDRDGSTPLK